MTKIDFLVTRDLCMGKEGNARDINLIKTFLKKGYSSGTVTSCQRIHSQLKKEGIFSVQLLKEIKVPSELENIAERAGRIEEQYNIPSLRNFVFPEKCYYQEDEDFVFRTPDQALAHHRRHRGSGGNCPRTRWSRRRG